MMAKQHPDPSRRDVSRHEGPHHGWASDVDETRQKDNPSAHRSFHPEKYAPERGQEVETSKEERRGISADPGTSTGRRGEDRAKKETERGMRDTGPRGQSQRPSGTKDPSAYTGVGAQKAKRRPD
ncbi:hypothetical protein [Streptomyces sp. NPDC086787]|uniref:hypothetical protein n=1 Tax=Streptomyces sp. NPDC086787 TaxID=3365759 RepID=UPI0038053D3F